MNNELLNAVNTLARKNAIRKDEANGEELVQAAFDIVTKAVNQAAETAVDGDWIYRGDWSTCETVEQAEDQIDAAATQWDEMSAE